VSIPLLVTAGLYSIRLRFYSGKGKKTLPTFVDIFPLECKDFSVLLELNEKDRFEPQQKMRERRKKTNDLASTTRKIMNVGRWPELLAQEKKKKKTKKKKMMLKKWRS
jgi:hypothetical protein